jgi:glycosyltransferase involved in cell wall biosynthesis
MSTKLLTIAIPTYNRSHDLDFCLERLTHQLTEYANDVEMLISDNASTDYTPQIVDKYLHRNLPIQYIRNPSNIGPDRNFLQCYQLATTKYVLIFGDDDIFLDGSLGKIVKILKSGEYGVVELSAYLFKDDYIKEAPAPRPSRIYRYQNISDFIIRCNISFTFLSVNIFNKSLIDPMIDFRLFNKTNLNQIVWTLSAVFNSQKNIFVYEYLIAGKMSPTTHLNHLKIYGINFEKIKRYFQHHGVKPAYTRTLENQFIFRDMFYSLYYMRRDNPSEFRKQKPLQTLYPAFGHNPLYWILLWPVSKLPLKVIKMGFALDNLYRIVKRKLFVRH